MPLQARSVLPHSVAIIVVDGSTMIALDPRDSVERLAECLVLLHEQRGGPVLRAELKFVLELPPTLRATHMNREDVASLIAKEPRQ